MKSCTAPTKTLLMVATVVFCIAAVTVNAQVKTETTTENAGPATVTTTVERGTVVYVSGNDLVVKAEDGTIRHFANVPESARALVDGQELGIHDLKPGMTLQRTITTTSTPNVIKTVKSGTGTVWYVNPPSSVILTMENGKNQQFKIPEGQKFNVDGQMVDAWGLRKGMKVSATKVVEVPETEVTRQAKVTGKMPPPPPPPPADVPILIVEEVPVPAPAPTEVAQALPKTASPLFLIGFLGLFSLASSWTLKAFRSDK